METNPETDSVTMQIEPFFYNNGHEEFKLDNFLTPLIQIKEKEQDQHMLHESSNKILHLEKKNDINQKDAEQANHITNTVLNNIQRGSKTNETDNNNAENDVKNTHKIQTYVHISDRIVTPRAVQVLPPALQFRRNVISPRRLLPPHVRFGPIQGIEGSVTNLQAKQLILMAAKKKLPIFLLKKGDSSVTYIDVSDKDKSNWFSLLHLGDSETSNVWIYEDNNELYGITTESIPPRKALMLGYSKTYSEAQCLPEGQPVLDLTECYVKTNNWWCYECRRSMASALSLQRHINAYHKDDYIFTRKRYRCRLCSRTFSRLYTLKRHVARYCIKNGENTQNKISIETMPGVSLNTPQSTDDNRIPSDESFQNYSNSLDFSTNLFDDRMPGFDITTGNYRSECDFSMYDTTDREESVLVNDLGLITKLDFTQTDQIHTQQNSSEQLLVSSNDSVQTIAKETKLQHLSIPPGPQFILDRTAKNALSENLNTVDIDTHTEPNQPETFTARSEYKCEECQLSFKRRGMLVNHLWRVHETKPVSVPLAKRVRHYPCVACTKIYRTAAKRDKHVLVHHPGAENLKAQPIDGGLLAYEPAACVACPRQYATRAKMLQHVRQHHPHLAPPVLRTSYKLKS